jgi:hypothetical protein
VYWSSPRLLIRDVHSLLEPFPDLPSSFRLHTHPVSRAEVLGVIVGVQLSRGRSVIYTIDDGRVHGSGPVGDGSGSVDPRTMDPDGSWIWIWIRHPRPS